LWTYSLDSAHSLSLSSPLASIDPICSSISYRSSPDDSLTSVDTCADADQYSVSTASNPGFGDGQHADVPADVVTVTHTPLPSSSLPEITQTLKFFGDYLTLSLSVTSSAPFSTNSLSPISSGGVSVSSAKGPDPRALLVPYVPRA
jgi:hypothetical protein